MRATQLGTSCVNIIQQGLFGVLLGLNDNLIVPVPLADVAGKHKTIPLDHEWLQAARNVGTCFGD
jgi:6-phosphofructokinase 1